MAVVESLEPLTVPERKLLELNYVHVHAAAWTLPDLVAQMRGSSRRPSSARTRSSAASTARGA
ncbi:MAG TPA: hypothetical protein VGI68_12425 [Mycobacterium sp.]